MKPLYEYLIGFSWKLPVPMEIDFLRVIRRVQSDTRRETVEECIQECLKIVPQNTFGMVEPIAEKCANAIRNLLEKSE